MNIYRWLLGYVWQQKFFYLIGIASLIVTNLLTVKIPLYFKEAFDIIQTPDTADKHRLALVLATSAGFALLIVIFRTASRTFFFNPSRKIETQIKSDLYAHLNRLPANYFQKHQTGSIISKLNNDIVYIRLLCGFAFLQITNLALMFSLAPYNMWQISATLTYYCLIPLVLGLVTVRLGLHYIMKYMRQRSKDLQKISSFTIAALNGFDVIKGYQIEPWSKRVFSEHNAAILHSSLGLAYWRIFTTPVLMNLEDIMKIIIFSFAGLTLLSNPLTVGDLAAFLAYIAILTPPLASLGWLATMLRQSTVALNNLAEIFNEPQRKSVIKTRLNLDLTAEFNSSGLTVKNLSFRYPQASKKTLDQLSFVIKPQQTTGLLGKVGSGKTTLVNCLSKLLPVERGCIFIGAVDICDVSESQWREVLLTVDQNPFLFSGTVVNNILLFNEQFNHQAKEQNLPQLPEIITMADLKDEVASFPKQEEELIGEKGITLSGGQKQRIALARAFARRSGLLILDSVLSAVDYATETKLVDQIFKNHTASSLLMISHRTQAISKADNILLLDQGKIAAQGSHQALLQSSFEYRQVWEMQTNK